MPTLADMTEQPQPQKARTLDARSLRGIAHPLRMRLLGSLRIDGPATASQLASRFSESSGSTSYHLRQLAAHGFVEDDPQPGKGRERWWRATHQYTEFSDTLTRDADPAVRGAAALYMHEVAALHAEALSTWVGTSHEWPEEWQASADISDTALRLTPALASELDEKVRQLIESYRESAPTEDDPQAELVRIHTHVFPTRRPD
ncbi:helix-turn-helix domain-containing protein [Streptomyces sp. NPDC056486]|uniref:helix-turn-helix domain-containing protein n=1 Tax=Streptomyces sp. NPDC056486 TaxID=3345835 RepID=UPI0036CBCF4C